MWHDIAALSFPAPTVVAIAASVADDVDGDVDVVACDIDGQGGVIAAFTAFTISIISPIGSPAVTFFLLSIIFTLSMLLQCIEILELKCDEFKFFLLFFYISPAYFTLHVCRKSSWHSRP